MMSEPALDRAAIEALYRSHGALVRRRARAMLGSDDDALDAVQNIFARLIDRPESFQGRSRASTFLYAVTTNHCLQVLRDRNNRRRIVDDKVTHELPKQAAPHEDSRAELRRVLAQLPADVAAVAVYYYIDEMTQDRIAEMLSVHRRRVAALLEEFTTRSRAVAQGAAHD